MGELNALFDETGDGQPNMTRVRSFGLTIAKKIIAGVGGTIFSDSRATGVTISVVVPWRSAMAEPNPHLRRPQSPLDQSGIGGQQS
jgi:hypothetical protein